MIFLTERYEYDTKQKRIVTYGDFYIEAETWEEAEKHADDVNLVVIGQLVPMR